MLIKPSKEILWHFVCSYCKGWWSIAVMDGWKPKKMFCPHCGIKQAIKNEDNA